MQMQGQSFKSIEILLVEDNPGDVRLVEEVFKEAKIKNRLVVAYDGISALEILKGTPEKPPFLPDLILLDLNLPRKDGRELLDELKRDPVLKLTPIVVLTTSDSDKDILKCYDLHANCYITKPVGFENFVEVVHSIENFWLIVAKLPKR